jgi:hypothetical protein
MTPIGGNVDGEGRHRLESVQIPPLFSVYSSMVIVWMLEWLPAAVLVIRWTEVI